MAAPIALQLYTVRDALARNFKSVVTRIAEIGYVGVETAGFPGIGVDEASDLFADLGLDVCSMHTQLPLGKQKNQVIELAHELEATRIVSSTPRDAFASADALKALCDRWNQAAEIAAENGLELGLHNHWWEFQEVDGRPGFEQLVDALDESIFFQVDTYWVNTGGGDSVQVVEDVGRASAAFAHQGRPMRPRAGHARRRRGGHGFPAHYRGQPRCLRLADRRVGPLCDRYDGSRREELSIPRWQRAGARRQITQKERHGKESNHGLGRLGGA